MKNLKFGLVAASILTSLISVTSFAADLDAHRVMSNECVELAKSGKVKRGPVRSCIQLCNHVDDVKESSDASLALEQCKNAYEKVTQNKNVKTTKQYRTHDDWPKNSDTKESNQLADIEGVYVQSGQNGFQIRVEGRKDWQTYCNGAARLMQDGYIFAQKVKVNDRVRFSGINFNPAKANKRITRCRAQSAVILEPATP